MAVFREWFFGLGWDLLIIACYFWGCRRWYQYRIQGKTGAMKPSPSQADLWLIQGGLLAIFCLCYTVATGWHKDAFLLWIWGIIFWGSEPAVQGDIRRGVWKAAGWGCVIGIAAFLLLGATTGSFSPSDISLWITVGIIFGGGLGFILGAFLVKEKGGERGVSYWMDQGVTSYSNGSYVQAIAAYTQAITLDPEEAMDYYSRGLVYGGKGDYDQAIADLTQAITLYPQHALSYYGRGFFYFSKGEHDSAITDYTQAITLDPGCDLAFNNRGSAYVAKAEHDPAIADYTQAIQINPSYTNAYYNRGWTYLYQHQYKNALEDFAQVIRLTPGDASAYLSRGIAYVQAGEQDQAIAEYTEAIV